MNAKRFLYEIIVSFVLRTPMKIPFLVAAPDLNASCPFIFYPQNSTNYSIKY